MRIFDVGNSRRIGFWCAAPDAEAAIEIALAVKHAKKRESLRVTDVTDRFLQQTHHDLDSIRAIVNGDKTGRVIGRASSFTAKQLFESLRETGRPPVTAKTKWMVV